MGKKKIFIPKGKIFIETFGEYSDYIMVSVCRALKDIYPKKITEEFLFEKKGETSKDSRYYEFVNWMIINGYAEEFEYDELHAVIYYREEDINLDLK